MATRAKKKTTQDGDCTIPGPVPVELANEVVFDRNEKDADDIRQYVTGQTHGEKVTHLERMVVESVFDRTLEGWNVWTEADQYWVITNPTNLYSQKLFPSLDYTITFHVGLIGRMSTRDARTAPDTQRQRLAEAARKWEQAAEAFGTAKEREEFQVVGLRCRECLISLINAIASPDMVPDGTERPKASDFIHWSELIANHVAKGSSSEYVRAYLKHTAKTSWQLVAWLTHASSAIRYDAQMALDATQAVLAGFSTAIFRYEGNAPDRCPRCTSYRLDTIYEPVADSDQEYFTLCQSCGWNNIPETKPKARAARRKAAPSQAKTAAESAE